jgi:predicted tellurium resistance membrane protein TerC
MSIDKKQAISKGLFNKQNYLLMLAGLIVLAIGFFLMAGGKSADPKVFNDNEVYSTTRITIAPLMIIAGFIIEIFAIMKKPADSQK